MRTTEQVSLDEAVLEAAEAYEHAQQNLLSHEGKALFAAVRARREAMKPKPRYSNAAISTAAAGIYDHLYGWSRPMDVAEVVALLNREKP